MATYSEKLQDPRWQKLRAAILDAANWRCEDCGCGNRALHVHHTAYKMGREPWEYTINHLMALCDGCHEKRQKLEDSFRLALGELTRYLKPEQLESEVWRILQDVSTRETQRLAEAFSND